VLLYLPKVGTPAAVKNAHPETRLDKSTVAAQNSTLISEPHSPFPPSTSNPTYCLRLIITVSLHGLLTLASSLGAVTASQGPGHWARPRNRMIARRSPGKSPRVAIRVRVSLWALFSSSCLLSFLRACRLSAFFLLRTNRCLGSEDDHVAFGVSLEYL
jgi:hypothetical protein